MLRQLVALSTLGICFAFEPICNTDDDCSLNGICEDGECKCSEAWRGSTCGELNLQPARLSPNSGYDEAGSTSWGGSIIQDPNDSGQYHMFVSRMTQHCGMHSWTGNSEIIRAVASDPEGPYQFREVVVPAFAHGPSIRQLKDGRFMLMHLGCGEPNKPEQNCSGGSASIEGVTGFWSNACDQFHISIRTSSNLAGPWSDGSRVLVESGRNSTGWWWEVESLGIHSLSNPAPYVLDDGSVALAFRATSKTALSNHVSVATAKSISGPYYDHRLMPAIRQEAEDPYLWQDERGHWHMLMHRMMDEGPHFVGGHAFSRDMKTWTFSNIPPYSLNVTYEDGSIKRMQRRERPQLLTDAQGRPMYLATGAWNETDHAYTLVMRVGTQSTVQLSV